MSSRYVETTTDITRAAKYIADGRVVAVPTGTSYGLAVDALQGWALQRLRILKQRPEEKTFTVCVRPSDWKRYLRLTAAEHALLTWGQDRPLTVLVRPTKALSHLAQDGRVGVRCIDHPLMRQLLDTTAVPLTATSANITGQQACYDAACILDTFPGLLPPDQLGEDDPRGAIGTTYNLSLAAVLDAGRLEQRTSSTIVRLDKASPTIVRDGSVSISDITNALQ